MLHVFFNISINYFLDNDIEDNKYFRKYQLAKVKTAKKHMHKTIRGDKPLPEYVYCKKYEHIKSKYEDIGLIKDITQYTYDELNYVWISLLIQTINKKDKIFYYFKEDIAIISNIFLILEYKKTKYMFANDTASIDDVHNISKLENIKFSFFVNNIKKPSTIELIDKCTDRFIIKMSKMTYEGFLSMIWRA